MTYLRLRGNSARSGLPAAGFALGLVLILSACGGQIPFGTPRLSSAAPSSAPSGGPATSPTPGNAGVTAAPGSEAPTSAASTPASATPTPGGTQASPGSSDASESLQPAATPAANSVTYRVPAAGLSLTLPAGWVGYDASSPDASVDAAAREHPELQASFDALQSGQASFVALDASATGEGQPVSMAISSPGSAIPAGPLLEGLAERIAESIRSGQPIGEVTLEPVELSSGEAYNLHWQTAGADGAEPLGYDAYVLSLPERTYLVTFSGPASAMEGSAPAFRGIIDSMAPLEA